VYLKATKDHVRGDLKMIWVTRISADKGEARETELQLNRYRLFLEDAGMPVDRMQIECIVRDGGTWMATDRGVDRSMYLIPVRPLQDGDVRDYFERKGTALVSAVSFKQTPPPCTPEETWKGRRCLDFCDVWNFCDEGKKARLGK
jgi:hypothetical protein